MLGAVVFFIIVALAIWLSVRERLRQMYLARADKPWEVEPVSSPFARAVAHLVGVAGGIYLSLMLAVNFLEVSVPARVTLGPVTIEPIAAIAIGLALVQPFVLRLLVRLRRHK